MRDERPYLLLTPGPLSTTRTVREAMLRDLSTWDVDYNRIVQSVRARLVSLAAPGAELEHTAVLVQGSGTFSVEATLGSVIPADGKLLVASNGAYGVRMGRIAARLGMAVHELEHGETEPLDPRRLQRALDADPAVTHVAFVHCETTTGMLNPAEELGTVARERGKVVVVDAMSSFGGVPFTMRSMGAHFLVSSANKCVQGVPGFGFVIAEEAELARCEGRARSLSLDLHDQWRGMQEGGGKWRFTSPTHTVLAFDRALDELAAEGGVEARHARYAANQRTLVEGMERLGFRPLLPGALQSPIITAFHDPRDRAYAWPAFYAALKERGFVIYPGKVTDADTFRIGTIGDVFPADVERLLDAVAEALAVLSIRDV